MRKYHQTEMSEYEERERQVTRARLARTLAPSFDSAANQLRKITSEQQEHMNMLLARWIATHFRPLIMIEDEGFLEFVTYITLDLGHVCVNIPKRNQLRRFIVLLASDLRAEVRNDIDKTCLYFSITSDIWTARNARSYISFTVHYVNENFEPRNWTLEVVELPGIHTGEVIEEKLKYGMDKWGLCMGNCTRFVHDSGSNMVSAAGRLGFENTPCLAHELHLVVSGALAKQKKSSEMEAPAWASIVDDELDSIANEHDDDDELNESERIDMERLRDLAIDEMFAFADEVLLELEKNAMGSMREIVQSIRSLSTYFRRSSKAHNRLADIQRKKGDENTVVVNMIVDCPTRWNSCVAMLQRSIKLQGALDAFFFQHLHTEEGRTEFKDMRNKLSKPKHKDWLAIDCLCALLKPFESVSTQLGAQVYPTLPLVMSGVAAIEAVIEDNQSPL